MYGKHFDSLYEGSMVGAGAIVFAVWGYVIAKQVPDPKVGSQVRLNPVLLAAAIGEKQEDIEKAIEYLCSPDPKSTTKAEQGKRLIKLGEFDYQVVNGAKYRAIRTKEERLESNRQAQRRFREKRHDSDALDKKQGRQESQKMANEDQKHEDFMGKQSDDPTKAGSVVPGDDNGQF